MSRLSTMLLLLLPLLLPLLLLLPRPSQAYMGLKRPLTDEQRQSFRKYQVKPLPPVGECRTSLKLQRFTLPEAQEKRMQWLHFPKTGSSLATTLYHLACDIPEGQSICVCVCVRVCVCRGPEEQREREEEETKGCFHCLAGRPFFSFGPCSAPACRATSPLLPTQRTLCRRGRAVASAGEVLWRRCRPL